MKNTTGTGKVSGDEVLQMLSYLAWCNRCIYRDDFMENFEENAIAMFEWEPLYAKMEAKKLFDSISNNGLIETYQKYLKDEVLMKIFAETIKV